MVTVQDQECWLQAKLTSNSLRDIKIDLLELHINPDYESFIKKISDNNQQGSDKRKDNTVLKSGESFDCVFTLKIGVPSATLDFGDLRSLMIGSQGTRSNLID